MRIKQFEEKYMYEGYNYNKVDCDRSKRFDFLNEQIGTDNVIQGFYLTCEKETSEAIIDLGCKVLGRISIENFDSTGSVGVFRSFVQTIVNCKVIGYDEIRECFICERRSIVDEITEYLFDNLQVGDVIKGKVLNMVPKTGIIIDIGGGFGALLHFVEITFSKVEELIIFDEYQVIDVFVKNIDKKNKRIHLSYKQLFKCSFNDSETTLIIENIHGKVKELHIKDYLPVIPTEKSHLDNGSYYGIVKEFPFLKVIIDARSGCNLGKDAVVFIRKFRKFSDGSFGLSTRIPGRVKPYLVFFM